MQHNQNIARKIRLAMWTWTIKCQITAKFSHGQKIAHKILTKMESFSAFVMRHQNRFDGTILDEQWLHSVCLRDKGFANSTFRSITFTFGKLQLSYNIL